MEIVFVYVSIDTHNVYSIRGKLKNARNQYTRIKRKVRDILLCMHIKINIYFSHHLFCHMIIYILYYNV